jgi:glycosyltransferase involved in cell wall biosynthesis
MACGVPVVATNIPGTRELIDPGVTGWLVQPGDPLALRDAILDARKNPSLRLKIANHAREVVKDYSIASIARSYEALYQSISG